MNFNISLEYMKNHQNNIDKYSNMISNGGLKHNDVEYYMEYSRYSDTITLNNQYIDSISSLDSQYTEYDNQLSHMESNLDDLKTLISKRINPSNGISENDINIEMNYKLSTLEDIFNTKYNKHYIFSGTKFNTKPIDDNLEYQGNFNSNHLIVDRDIKYEKHISPDFILNDEGNTFFKEIKDIIETTADTEQMNVIDDILERVSTFHTKIGALHTSINSKKENIELSTLNANNRFEALHNEEEYIVKLQESMQAYQATILAFNKSKELSLVNFLS